jgi:mannose-6-phosphate isomerase-like protein (cupin superfamily)
MDVEVRKNMDVIHFMEGDEHCRLYFKTDKLQFGTSTLMPGKGGAVDTGHKNGEEVFFIAKGKVLLFLPNKKKYFELYEGDAIIIPPGEAHQLFNPYSKQAVVSWSLAPPDKS